MEIPEEVILTEDRTTEEVRQHILNGKNAFFCNDKRKKIEKSQNRKKKQLKNAICLFSVRRRNAAKKRKLNAADKSKSTDTEDESTFDDEG